MDQSDKDDVLRRLDEKGLRAEVEHECLRIEEADSRSLYRFCQATHGTYILRDEVENYILELLDNVARIYLERVTCRNDITEYTRVLASWCREILPNHEQFWRRDVDDVVLRNIEERFGSIEGRIVGSVDRGKLAGRIAHWKSEAISQVLRIQAIEPAIANLRIGATPNVSGVPVPESTSNTRGKARKRGPAPDHDGFALIAKIVARVAPDGNWRSKLVEVGDALDHGLCNSSDPGNCDASDHEKIPLPRGWKKKKNDWLNPPDRATLVKAIEHRLKVAKQR